MATILFAGGDRRTFAAISYLKKQGFEVKTYALTHRSPVDGRGVSAMVLPYPCLKQGKLNAPMLQDPPTLEEVIAKTGIDVTVPVLGGPIPNNPFPHYTDLSLREDLKLRNGVTTAEGAVELLMKSSDRTVFGTKCLVVGFGAIGSHLAHILRGMGADVTVAVRKEEVRTKAMLTGYGVMDTKSLCLEGFHAIFNTVPHPLITDGVLKTSPPDALFFELASFPYGIDRAAAEKQCRRVIEGFALPGKVAPVTAGEDLAKTVICILQTL